MLARLGTTLAIVAATLLGAAPAMAAAAPQAASGTAEFSCPRRNGAFGDTQDPQVYYICVNWKTARTLRCPLDLWWSNANQNCVPQRLSDFDERKESDGLLGLGLLGIL